MVVVVGAGGLTGVEVLAPVVLAEVMEVFDVVVGGTGVDTPSVNQKNCQKTAANNTTKSTYSQNQHKHYNYLNHS
jgi:hypothetical protein